MTELVVEVDQALIATIEVSAGVGGAMGPSGTTLLTLGIRNNLVVGVGVIPLPVPFTKNIHGVQVAMGTAPEGADAVFDVLKNETSIFPTAAKPAVPDGTKLGAVAVPDDVVLTAGDVLTIDVVQIGSVTPGANATIVIEVV